MGVRAILKKMSVKLKAFFAKVFSKSSGEEAPGPEPTIHVFVLGEMGGDEDTEVKEDDDDKKKGDDDNKRNGMSNEQKKKEDDEEPHATPSPFQTEEEHGTVSSASWGVPWYKGEADAAGEERANALLDSIQFLPTIKTTNASSSLCSVVEEENEEEEGEERRGRSGSGRRAVSVRPVEELPLQR